MITRKICLGGIALTAFCLCGPALAKQGKVGLWNVTSSTQMVLRTGAAGATKGMGTSTPSATVQMCMSQQEVDSEQPPHLDRNATGCDTKIVKRTGSAMTASMVCKGNMKGTGTIQVTYNGAEHYSGFYSFTGTSGGQPVDMTTRFKGDWVKTDCGKVQPYKLRTQ